MQAPRARKIDFGSKKGDERSLVLHFSQGGVRRTSRYDYRDWSMGDLTLSVRICGNCL